MWTEGKTRKWNLFKNCSSSTPKLFNAKDYTSSHPYNQLVWSQISSFGNKTLKASSLRTVSYWESLSQSPTNFPNEMEEKPNKDNIICLYAVRIESVLAVVVDLYSIKRKKGRPSVYSKKTDQWITWYNFDWVQTEWLKTQPALRQQSLSV